MKYDPREPDRHPAAENVKKKKARQKGIRKTTKAALEIPGRTQPVFAAAEHSYQSPPDVLAPSDPHLQIDPALLSNHSINLNHGRDPIANQPDGDILVSLHEMHRLTSHGFPSSIPINGPNDGPPMYSVPAMAQGLLDSRNDTENQPHDPESPKKKSKKRVMTADVRAVQEAQKLVDKRPQTRGQTARRRPTRN